MIIEWTQRVVLHGQAAHPASWTALLADCCQVTEDIPIHTAVHAILTDDREIQKTNAAFRHANQATDVLSFPMISFPPGKTARDCLPLLRKEYDPDGNGALLGDVMISWEHVLVQAKTFGHSARREFSYLFAHGLFHLLGYDHMNPAQQKEMRMMEEKSLRMAGFSRGDSPVALDDKELLSLARLAMQRSYSPYSHFKVGACLLSADGRVFQGCNIENASFGLTNCAERTALFKAVSEGAMDFTAIAIAAEGAVPYPCGACRQALNEFAPNIRILLTWNGGKVRQTTLPELLPHGFGPSDLHPSTGNEE